MRSVAACALLALFAFSAVSAHELAAGSAVIDLTDADFETRTQISTGATTGDWFIMFYAPWCGHCKNMMPAWDETATALKGQVNIARVDATVNKDTAGRFGVKSYPTVFFFKGGKMYKYEGKPRTVEGFSAFVNGDYANVNAVPAPGPVTLLTIATRTWEDTKSDFASLIEKRRFGIIGALLVIGGSVGIVAGLFIGLFLVPSPAPKASAAAPRAQSSAPVSGESSATTTASTPNVTEANKRHAE